MPAEPVVLINSFEVPAGQEEEFLRFWEATRDFLSKQEGYLSTRLHRSLAPDAEFRFVNVAYWQSAQAFKNATSQPEFRSAGSPYRFHAALYEVALDDQRS
jgi:heme oxygenase (mycobilin-producing)